MSKCANRAPSSQMPDKIKNWKQGEKRTRDDSEELANDSSAQWVGRRFAKEGMNTRQDRVGMKKNLPQRIKKPISMCFCSFVIMFLLSDAGLFSSCLASDASRDLSWQIETVDNTFGAGDESSIATDGSSNLYLSYSGGALGGLLKFAENLGGAWKSETIDSSQTTIGSSTVPMFLDSCSIAVDANGMQHIAYACDNFTPSSSLRYATNNGGSWKHETIEDGLVGNWGPSIALDPTGNVYIGYCSYRNEERSANMSLKYATNAGGAWMIQTINASEFPIDPVSMCIDASGDMHIAYESLESASFSSRHSVMYATIVRGSIVTTLVDSDALLLSTRALAVDSQGGVHIAYVGATDHHLRYAMNSGGTWSKSVVDDMSEDSSSYSIAVDSNNSVHIAFYDDVSGYLKYATNKGGPWSESVVAQSLGFCCSITVDSKDKVHITYQDDATKHLCHATNARKSDSSPWNLTHILSVITLVGIAVLITIAAIIVAFKMRQKV